MRIQILGMGLAKTRSFAYFRPMKLEEIAAAASRLTEEERASLASRLLHGLESPSYQVPDCEIADRMEEAEKDPTVWLSFDQLVSGLKRRGA